MKRTVDEDIEQELTQEDILFELQMTNRYLRVIAVTLLLPVLGGGLIFAAAVL